MKRILIVDRYFYPDLQATAVLLTDLASHLSNHFAVEVMCGAPSKFQDEKSTLKLPAQLKVTQLPATNFNQHHLLGRLANYFSFLCCVPLAILFHARVDLILVQTTPPLLSFAVSLACRVKRIPYIYVCQDLFPFTAIKSGLIHESFLTQCLADLNRSAIRHASYVVALGRDMAKRLKTCGAQEEQIKVIPNWTDVTPKAGIERDNPFAKAQQLTGCFVVMHAGNFGYVQDFDFLLEVAEHLKEDTQIKIVLIGGGAVRGAVAGKAKEKGLSNVYFLPFQERTEVSLVLGSADLQVVSLKKGLSGYSVPSKTYAILACGKALLGAVEKDSEVAYLIEEAQGGLVTGGKTAEAVAEEIKQLKSEPHRIKTWEENVRRFAQKKNFREAAFEAYERLIREASA